MDNSKKNTNRIYDRSQLPLIEIKNFIKKVKVCEKNNSCWLWSGSLLRGDYHGVMQIKGEIYPSHRLSWMIFKGSIKNITLSNSCDNKYCINPEHLYISEIKLPINIGENNFNTKLTADLVLEIREAYKAGNLSHRELAELYHVDKSTVGRVIRLRTWKHIN